MEKANGDEDRAKLRMTKELVICECSPVFQFRLCHRCRSTKARWVGVPCAAEHPEEANCSASGTGRYVACHMPLTGFQLTATGYCRGFLHEALEFTVTDWLCGRVRIFPVMEAARVLVKCVQAVQQREKLEETWTPTVHCFFRGYPNSPFTACERLGYRLH